MLFRSELPGTSIVMPMLNGYATNGNAIDGHALAPPNPVDEDEQVRAKNAGVPGPSDSNGNAQ